MIFDWRGALYKGCCPLGRLCAEHLKQHQRACGYPEKPCDVCKIQPHGLYPVEALRA